MNRIIAILLVATLATSLFGESKFISGTGFETYGGAGTNLNEEVEQGGGMWHPSETKKLATVTKYASDDEKPTHAVVLPSGNATNRVASDVFPYDWYRANAYDADGANTTYLAIDSGDTILTRMAVHANVTESKLKADKRPGSLLLDAKGLYVDTMVQFTATDTLPTPVDYVDKLLVCLYSPPENPSATNLVIVAGYYDSQNRFHTKNYVIPTDCVEICEWQWYRLTIAMSLDALSASTSDARFRVYIDGKQMEAEDSTKEFWSLVGSGKFIKSEDDKSDCTYTYSYKTIREIGFNGEGTIDDIVFGTQSPYLPDKISFEIHVGEGITGFEYSLDESGADAVWADIANGVCTITNVAYLGETIYFPNVVFEEGYRKSGDSPRWCVVTEYGNVYLNAETIPDAIFTVVAGDDGKTSEYDKWSKFYGDFTNRLFAASTSFAVALNKPYTMTKDEATGNFSNMIIVLDLCGNELRLEGEMCINCNLTIKDSIGGGRVAMAPDVQVFGKSLMLVPTKLTIDVPDTTVFDNLPISLYGSGTIEINGGKFFAIVCNKTSGLPIEASKYNSNGLELTLGADNYYTLAKLGSGNKQSGIDNLDNMKYETAEAAQAAAEAYTAPVAAELNVDELTTYKSYVKAEADGTTVNILLKDDENETLHNQADEGAAAIAKFLSGNKDSVSVPVIPGLYYSVESGSESPADLTEGERTLAKSGQNEVTLSVQKSENKCFYRIRISPVDKKKGGE